MTTAAKSLRRTGLLAIVSALAAFSASTVAAPLNLPDVPLYLPASVPPLNMLVLGRDHKLYYEAYNDYTDLNDDGVLDLKYKPTEIKAYFGYFDSSKCYAYQASKRFEPSGNAGVDKTCNGAWSGDFLNYLTTSRIDALRKVLYGGYRSTDTESETVLERSLLPQDAHSWGKEYTSVAVDGYDISKYTPLALPTSGTRHLFANTTLLGATEPLLRVLQNRSERIWNWVSIERPVAGNDVLNAAGQRVNIASSITDYSVRVKVCVTKDDGCALYPNGKLKPTGLLQEYGENDSMFFGLLSGSYAKNMSGGVLRREISSIKDEVDPQTGILELGVKSKDGSVISHKGIITTLNRLQTTGFGGNYEYKCGFASAARTMTPGECQMWGNPVAEMMYESTRYFAGLAAPTSAFSITEGQGEESDLPGKRLPVATWDDPYKKYAVCAKPFQTVISDINPSYDTDEVPGSAFASVSDDLGGLNASALGQSIWNNEFAGASTQSIFIGDVNGVTDGAPTAKTATSFGNIRGLSPEEPTKQGGFYAASVAYFGHKTDVNPADRDQKVTTFSVALASPLPKISIPVNGKTITLVPFAKSVNGSGIDVNSSFQPTDQIVDFYVDTLTPTSGRFRVNFEDVEQGADHDMDAITVYEYRVVGDQVEITLTSEYAAGGITQHMGYVISGTDGKDGIYLEVLDQRNGDSAGDVDYRLDTPPTFTGRPPAAATASGWKDNKPLPFVATRTFSAGSTDGATILKDPLWYAAKWGGYDESKSDTARQNDIPDLASEWDTDKNGTPDNYFLVTNALKLSAQLRSAFDKAKNEASSASSAAVNSGSISSETRIFQAKFNPGIWTGQLLSYKLDLSTGVVGPTPQWDASTVMPAFDARNIVTYNSNYLPVDFKWTALDDAKKAQLGSELILNYLRGETKHETDEDKDTNLRVRPPNTDPVSTKKNTLGDIVSSSPLFVGAPPFRYRDSVSDGGETYSKFAADRANRPGMVYTGANDGMLHGFRAADGVETFAFIPSAVFSRLPRLSVPTYSHEYFVDGPPSMGDVMVGGKWRTVVVGGLNKGGQEIYALNVTDPTALGTGSVMWEFKDADTDPSAVVNGDSDLGLTFSQPSIVKMRNGKWAAVFGNGYNSMTPDDSTSTTGNAVLYVVDIETGNLMAKLDTNVGFAQAKVGVAFGNGLSTPALVDLNGDRVVEYAFAGDLYGNMWKFDLTSTNPTNWKVAFAGAPLYRAKDKDGNDQPITDRPEVARGPAGQGMVVLFGTGKYLEPSDKLTTPQRVQSFYGIVDTNLGVSGDHPSDRSQLTKQTILAEVTVNPSGSGPISLRATSANPVGTNLGWYIDLVSPSLGYQGERQVSNPIVRNGNVIFTTLIPDKEVCEAGGKSWLMEMNLLSGSRLEVTPFDLNNDGKFTETDNLIKITLTDGSEVFVPASGIGSTEGILQTPGVADGTLQIPGETGPGHPVQFKYLPGSTGKIQQITENPGKGGVGRQSWRQIR